MDHDNALVFVGGDGVACGNRGHPKPTQAAGNPISLHHSVLAAGYFQHSMGRVNFRAVAAISAKSNFSTDAAVS